MPEKPSNQVNSGTIFSRIGIVLIAIYSVLYSVYYRSFAELNIQLSFLDFPIFVGEILLFTVSILFILHWKSRRMRLNRYHWIALVYVIWVLIKAFHGYYTLGPLAFRNAALFYYPFFLIISFHFYEKLFLSQKMVFILLLAFFLIIRFIGVATYFKVPYLIVLIILAFQIKNPISKCLVFGLLIYLFPWEGFLANSRSHLIAALCSCLFVCLSYFFVVMSGKMKYKTISFCASLTIILFLFYKYGDVYKLKSLIDVKRTIDVYKMKEAQIAEREDSFTFQPIEPKLYNKEGIIEPEALSELSIEEVIRSYALKPEIIEQIFISELKRFQQENVISSEDDNILSNFKITEEILYKVSQRIRNEMVSQYDNIDELNDYIRAMIRDIINEEIKGAKETGQVQPGAPEASRVEMQKFIKRRKEKGIAADRINTIFRYYIWKDMIREIISEKAIWGVSFGKPQRSKSLEILGWARGEWVRDGWITPHNSFLHMIYRAGIVGVAILYAIAAMFLSAVKMFYRHKSLTGILFLSILIYWSVISNFLVILEFPYIAIPFWSLFGAILAYGNNLSISAEDVRSHG